MADEPWASLRRSLIDPVAVHRSDVEVLTKDHAPDDLVAERVAVQRASFANSTFTAQRWRTMCDWPAYHNARCLIGYASGLAVAATTVWSAGPARPGLIEPLGTHRDHRGHGYGRDIALAAAAELRRMGASSVVVATPSSNVAAVAAYASAGFERLPDVCDLRSPG